MAQKKSLNINNEPSSNSMTFPKSLPTCALGINLSILQVYALLILCLVLFWNLSDREHFNFSLTWFCFLPYLLNVSFILGLLTFSLSMFSLLMNPWFLSLSAIQMASKRISPFLNFLLT